MTGVEGNHIQPAMVEAMQPERSGVLKIGSTLLGACIGISALGGAGAYGVYEYQRLTKSCDANATAESHDVMSALTEAQIGQYAAPDIRRSYAGKILMTHMTFGSGQLTFYAPPVSAEQLNQVSGQQLLDDTEAFVEAYGIDVELYDGSQKQAFDGLDAKTFQTLDTNSLTTKQAMMGVMTGLSELPVEFVHQMGVKRIYFSGNIKGLAGEANTNGVNQGNVILNMAVPINDDTVVHEMSHQLDGIQCGGSAGQIHDAAYLSYNDGQIYDDESAAPLDQKPISGQAKYFSTARGASYLAGLRFDCIGLAVAYKQIQVESDYAYTNVAEDKAELYAAILTGETSGGVYDARSPRLRAKAIELLGRIKQQSGAMFDYLMYRYKTEALFTEDQQQSCASRANP